MSVEAVIHGDGTRHCAWCGDHIDPVDWCPSCSAKPPKACRAHRRLRKRSDAAYCNAACRSADNSNLASIRRGSGTAYREWRR